MDLLFIVDPFLTIGLLTLGAMYVAVYVKRPDLVKGTFVVPRREPRDLGGFLRFSRAVFWVVVIPFCAAVWSFYEVGPWAISKGFGGHDRGFALLGVGAIVACFVALGVYWLAGRSGKGPGPAVGWGLSAGISTVLISATPGILFIIYCDGCIS